MATRRKKPKPPPGPDLGQFLRARSSAACSCCWQLSCSSACCPCPRAGYGRHYPGDAGPVRGGHVDRPTPAWRSCSIWLALRHVAEHRASAWRIAGILGLLIAFEGFARLVTGLPDPSIPGNETLGGGAGRLAVQPGADSCAGAPPAAIATLLVIAFFSVMRDPGLTVTDVGQKLSALAAAFRREPPVPKACASTRPCRSVSRRTSCNAGCTRLRERRTPLKTNPAFPPVTSGPATRQPGRPTAAPRPRCPTRARPSCAARASTGATAAGERRRTPGVPGAPPGRASSAAAARPGTCPSSRRFWKTAPSRTSSEKTCASASRSSNTRWRGSACRCRWSGSTKEAGCRTVGLRPGIIVRKDRKGEEKADQGARLADSRRSPADLSLALAASPSASRRLCRAAISSASKCRT